MDLQASLQEAYDYIQLIFLTNIIPTCYSIKYLRLLLPLQKVMKEVIVTEPFGTVSDAKGNKTREVYSADKKMVNNTP